MDLQVMAETSGNVAVAFDQIDKAPEEKARGITIATAHGPLPRFLAIQLHMFHCAASAAISRAMLVHAS